MNHPEEIRKIYNHPEINSPSFHPGGSDNAKDEQLKNNFKYNSLAREALLAEVLPENMGAIYMKRPDGSIYRMNYLRRANGVDEDFLVPGFVITADGLLTKYGTVHPANEFPAYQVSDAAIASILDREEKEFIKAMDAAVFPYSTSDFKRATESGAHPAFQVTHRQMYLDMGKVHDNALTLSGENIRLFLCAEDTYDRVLEDLSKFVEKDMSQYVRRSKHIELGTFYTVPRKSALGALPIFLELGFYDVEQIIRYYPAATKRIEYAQENGGLLLEEVGIAIVGQKHIWQYTVV